MRNALGYLLVLVLSVSLILAGCGGQSIIAPASQAKQAATQDSPQTTAYKALRSAADTYDATMKTVATLYKQGIISTDVKAQAIKYGNVFRTAYGRAIDVLESGGTPSMATVSAALADLLNFLQPYLTKGGKA